jgi:lipopolysaccharide/colanic/teichoic acid biosynthesis glycosyltransferase
MANNQAHTTEIRDHRLALADELAQRFRTSSTLGMKMRFLRKKYAWLLVTNGTRFIKRAFDVVVSGVTIIAFSPLFILTALLIKLTDGGPVFYWQIRVGQFGREFPFPKFRSMVTNADEVRKKLLQNNDHGDSVTFKMKRDPRITWIGRIIRKLSIDETPQLWTVFNGDMALVGPRPPLPSEVEKYTLRDRRRLDVKPGLTCIWQVSGRADIPFQEQVELDIEYIESQSLWLDFKLLVKTVPAVLLGRGAY